MDNRADFTPYTNRIAVRSEAAHDLFQTRTTHPKASSETLHAASTVYEQQPDVRVALTLLQPAGFLGTTDPIKWTQPSHAIPPFVQGLLCELSPAHAELRCVPQTPEIDTLLADTFPHEVIQPHNRYSIPDPDDHPAALAMVHSAILIHRKALYNSRHAEDASAWHPIVRQLLCSSYGGRLPHIVLSPDEEWAGDDDSLQVVDASTKTISALLPPAGDVKIDLALVSNARQEHSVRRALGAGVRMNVFCDPNLAGKLVLLGCCVKTACGPPVDTQYQLGVLGMKTLHLTRALARRKGLDYSTDTDVAVGVDVCGHVWSLHLTYWTSYGELVTHGPVLIGSTDTLVGTLKIARWMCFFEHWSAGVWQAWMVLLNGVTDSR